MLMMTQKDWNRPLEDERVRTHARLALKLITHCGLTIEEGPAVIDWALRETMDEESTARAAYSAATTTSAVLKQVGCV